MMMIHIITNLHCQISALKNHIIFMGINGLILLYLQTQLLYLVQNKHAGV